MVCRTCRRAGLSSTEGHDVAVLFVASCVDQLVGGSSEMVKLAESGGCNRAEGKALYRWVAWRSNKER